VNYEGGIIDMGVYNGRVDVISGPSAELRTKLYGKSWSNGKISRYTCPTEGIWESHVITRTFFSSANIAKIQNALREGVFRRSGERQIRVPPQNEDTLKIIMHSIFLQYVEFDVENVQGQVDTLNRLVLNYAIPDVLSAAVSYQKYLQDQSTLVVPLAHPQRPDKEWRQLILRQFVDETVAPPAEAAFEAKYVPAVPRSYEADFYDSQTGGDMAGSFYTNARIVYKPIGADGIPPPYGTLL
jgi:hypothetical protein